MLSQTSEHAIRAVLYLAQQPHGEPVPADRVAAALGAPANYLGKTLNALARRGLLASARGAAGGFRLVRAPEQVALEDVVAAVCDAPRASGTCLLGNRPCNAAVPCAAHARWSAVQEGLHAPLRRTTIADLLAGEANDFSARSRSPRPFPGPRVRPETLERSIP
ncbi:MAG TPA: Rrf2 family transcriptional regulator [Longimicrobium sp.]|nr:Rrf2 family transcriptional regulator [Longimicrobium sp.]